MEVLPSLDLQAGRSRLVWWPGASTGAGTPTDRADAIAAAFVQQGATAIHLVDLDGARQGRPANLAAVQAVARAVATPLQLAGGVDGAEQIEIAFAAGATRVVMPLWAVAEDQALLARCLSIAGDWLAVGLDARPESLQGYPWRHREPPRLEELVAELDAAGVARFVISHVTSGEGVERLSGLARRIRGEILVAGGIGSLDELAALREGGIHGVILGEAIFRGAIDLAEARRVAA